MTKAIQCLLFAGFVLSPAAMAQTPEAPVQPKTENGLRYLCGGVGQDESEYMKSQARSHGLLMTSKKGDYRGFDKGWNAAIVEESRAKEQPELTGKMGNLPMKCVTINVRGLFTIWHEKLAFRRSRVRQNAGRRPCEIPHSRECGYG